MLWEEKNMKTENVQLGLIALNITQEVRILNSRTNKKFKMEKINLKILQHKTKGGANPPLVLCFAFYSLC